MSEARVIPFSPQERRSSGESSLPAGGPPPSSRAARETRGNRLRAVDQGVARSLAFLRRRMSGDYTIDEFGYDPELTETVLLAPFRPLFNHWFRVEVRGLSNIPDTGGALIVANHSGTLPLDAMMMMLAVGDRHPANRSLRPLGADLLFGTPFLGALARKSGATLACVPDAERLLAAGEVVGVWPEGYKGLGKPFRERYKLQRFGR